MAEKGQANATKKIISGPDEAVHREGFRCAIAPLPKRWRVPRRGTPAARSMDGIDLVITATMLRSDTRVWGIRVRLQPNERGHTSTCHRPFVGNLYVTGLVFEAGQVIFPRLSIIGGGGYRTRAHLWQTSEKPGHQKTGAQ